MNCRGIRGATSVKANDTHSILVATRELLEQIVTANDLVVDEIASVIFTTTSDLDAVYPARAAREMGWVNTPLLCVQEMAVAKGLARCIRVLLHWNTTREPDQIQHIYLRQARTLRPDLVKEKKA
jgi:chorismate mutase